MFTQALGEKPHSSNWTFMELKQKIIDRLIDRGLF